MDDEDQIYRTYLNAFIAVRSGKKLKEWEAGGNEEFVARALGASDGQDESMMPAPKWLVLAEVDRLINSEKKEEQSCKVVPMGDAEVKS